MRVAIIEPVGGHGGMNYYDFSLAEGLVAAGATVTLYTCDKTAVGQGLTFDVKQTFKKIWGTDHKILRASRFFFCLLKTLVDARLKRIDIVHFHFFHYTKMELLCVLLGRLFRFRIVVTAHDVESFSSDSSKSAAGKILAKVDKVIAHNNVSAKELIECLNFPVGRIAIIPHGNYLNTIINRPSPAEARQTLNLPPDAPVLLFFGQIKKVKGLDILLQALPPVISKFPTLKLVIAGKFWQDDFINYEKIIMKNNLRKNIDLHIKYIPDKEVAKFYCSADVVVLPYRKIYQSGVLLMAMSYGVPVVASDLEGMVEIISDGKNGYIFEKNNVGHLSLKLIDILSNPIEAEKVATLGTEFVRKNHSWQHIGNKTYSVYSSLLNRENERKRKIT